LLVQFSIDYQYKTVPEVSPIYELPAMPLEPFVY